MAIRKLAIVCAVLAVLALASASTLDLDLNLSEAELALGTESSLLELDNAIATVRAMDQDLSLAETGSKRGPRRGFFRKVGGAVKRGARKAARAIKRLFGRKKHRRHRKHGKRHHKRHGKRRHRRHGKRRHGKRRHHKKFGRKARLARRRKALKKKHAKSKAYQKRKLAKKLAHLARKSGNPELMAKARKAAKAARRATRKAAAKKVRKQMAKKRALKKKKKALKKKAKKAMKKAAKKAKKARKALKKAAKSSAKSAVNEAKDNKVAALSTDRAATNQKLADMVAGDAHMPAQLKTVSDTIEKMGAGLEPLVKSAAGKRYLKRFRSEVGRVNKMMAHIRNIYRGAQKKYMKAQLKKGKAKRRSRKVKHAHTPANPAEKHRLEALKEKAAKLKAKADKEQFKAEEARREAQKRADEELKRVINAKKLRKEAIEKLQGHLDEAGKKQLNEMVGKIIEAEKVADNLITNAKSIPLAVPHMTRKEVMKADPKGAFKKLDPNGVTAAEARKRIIKMHEENKFHDFSTMAMDNLLGTTAEIPPKFVA